MWEQTSKLWFDSSENANEKKKSRTSLGMFFPPLTVSNFCFDLEKHIRLYASFTLKKAP